MKFLVDMNLSPGWIDLLVKAGFEAAHWSSIGRGNESDAELMRWAAEHGHVVLTAAIGAAVLAAIRQAAGELENGAILGRSSTREASCAAVLASCRNKKRRCHLRPHPAHPAHLWTRGQEVRQCAG